MRARYIGSVVALLTVVAIAVLASNPLRRSKDGVHDWLLEKAPLGSSFDDVQALVRNEKWSAQEGWGGERNSLFPLRGVHWLQANVGNYRGVPFLLPCHVRVAWGFDDEKLVDIYVEKWCEGI